MYICSTENPNKVIHKHNCLHVRKIKVDNIRMIRFIDEAREEGYHLCKDCARMAKYYKPNRRAIQEFADQHNLLVSYYDGQIDILTPYSRWKIITIDKGSKISLYHKNERNNRAELTPIPGYHLQRIFFRDVIRYLEYIVHHEEFKASEAYRLSPNDDNRKAPPHKGTKRYRKEQRKKKRRERRDSINRVLSLIEYEEFKRTSSGA